jgi:protein-disulfide isomerase
MALATELPFAMKLAALSSAALTLSLLLAGCGKAESPAADPAASVAKIAPIAAPAGKSWAETVATTPEGGYRLGNPDAPIKLIEFASLTCSHCAEFAAKGFTPLREKYVASGRVSLEMRNFVRDPIDITAAMLTRCGAPESYFPLSEQVFANQPAIFQAAQAAGPKLEAAAALPENQRFVAIAQALGLVEFFAARGIAADQSAACLAKGQSATELAERASEQGKTFDVAGTPTFLVNGAKVPVASWEELEPILQRMGAR